MAVLTHKYSSVNAKAFQGLRIVLVPVAVHISDDGQPYAPCRRNLLGSGKLGTFNEVRPSFSVTVVHSTVTMMQQALWRGTPLYGSSYRGSASIP